MELLFTDIFRRSEPTAYLLGRDGGEENGENVFSISVNGRTVEENFAPCRESGYFHALRRRYIVNCETDHIEIHFHTLSGKCFLSGIKLRVL